jgi:hypothetical protein
VSTVALAATGRVATLARLRLSTARLVRMPPPIMRAATPLGRGKRDDLGDNPLTSCSGRAVDAGHVGEGHCLDVVALISANAESDGTQRVARGYSTAVPRGRPGRSSWRPVLDGHSRPDDRSAVARGSPRWHAGGGRRAGIRSLRAAGQVKSAGVYSFGSTRTSQLPDGSRAIASTP